MNKILSIIVVSIFLTACQENPMGTKSSIGANFYPGLGIPPKIVSISPNKGPFVGGTNITLNGVGFTKGSRIKIGGTTCSQMTYVSPVRVICLTPQHTIGPKDIKIENADGQNETLTQAFTYISNIAGTPGFGIVSGGRISESTNLKLQSTFGDPLSGQTMTGVTTQLRVGVRGILFQPAE